MGRTDVYVNDRLSILWEISRIKKEGLYDEGGKYDIIIEGPTLSVENGYLGFTNRDKGVFTYKEDFKKKFNAIIIEMKKSGKIDEIITEVYSK